jgi:RNA processing factor Prp31
MIKTFTCKDAKLRRLLLWYQHHESELGSCIPKHYYSQLRVRVTDVTKLRYTEKNELVHVLEAAETSLRRFRKQKEEGNARSKFKQQPITNYFFAK